ncbi:hypothetical protein GSUB_00210 [Geoalkalibacter subterraneus]|uniref:Uncharacterized protein n=1 Tax=Geoalkalibacter subterraneus TaxID=483547 RepID=A0A0B5FAX5_9BACT|nr:hypothetical protein GSUB_00210 [Geoalkalibacter subterraneus]
MARPAVIEKGAQNAGAILLPVDDKEEITLQIQKRRGQFHQRSLRARAIKERQLIHPPRLLCADGVG